MKYDWVNIYQEFANKLLEYKSDRQKLIATLKNIYEEVDMRYPLLYESDICPFTTFGLFNRKINDENKFKLLEKIKEKFNLNSQLPTSFSGIPIVNNLNIKFYTVKEDINNLWLLFESAINYADNKNNKDEFCLLFDQVINQYNVKWKLTIGLFWIRPYEYLSLDEKNRLYLMGATDEFNELKNITDFKTILSSEKYLKVIDICKKIFDRNAKFKDFIDFSDNAYNANKKQNAQFLKWFKPILDTLKKLGGSSTRKEVINQIIKDKNLTNEEISEVRGKNKVNKLENDISFARQYLIYEDLIDDSERGIWTITEKGRNINMTKKVAADIFKKWVAKNKHKRESNEVNQQFISDSYLDNMSIDENLKQTILDDVFISDEQCIKIKNTLKRKKNIILQGVPGVGKTFCAKKLFFSMINCIDENRVVTVQFHQSYSYEDFVQGYRPNDDGKFKLQNGVFYNIVDKARKEYEKAIEENREPLEYCIIIDEINRGNLSKIFGELLMLIEADKRKKEWAIKLTYSKKNDELFYIPSNLYIIGTMNTADRSLATIDYALKRRFSFITLNPSFKIDKFKNYLLNKEKIDEAFVTSLIKRFDKLNEFLRKSFESDNFVIGHSYFIHQLKNDNLQEIYDDIIEYEIKPLLEEYFLDDKPKISEALKIIGFDYES